MTGISPPHDAPADWQCPGCLTHYSPQVRECRCEADNRTLADRIVPQPPVRLGGGTISLTPEVVVQT